MMKEKGFWLTLILAVIFVSIGWSVIPANAAGYYGYPRNINASSVTASGAVNGSTVTASGAVNGSTVTASGAVNGATVTASGAISGGGIHITGSVSGITSSGGFFAGGTPPVSYFVGAPVDTTPQILFESKPNNFGVGHPDIELEQVGPGQYELHGYDGVSTNGSMTIEFPTGIQLIGPVQLSAAVTSTKTCATGYTRLTPNYCQAVPGAVQTVPTTCTAIAAPASDAQALKLNVVAFANSANSVAERYAQPSLYTDSGCTIMFTNLELPQAWAMEFSAIAAGTTLSENSAVLTIKLPSVGTTIYGISGNDLGGSSYVHYEIEGYFD